ncbi:MAG: hypothetical protein IRY95_01235, partial [Clostridia bacterium]|nr:hypothetical protein [Clostridia bacterium]
LDIGRVREELARKVRAAAAVPRWKLLASRRPAGGGGTGGRASPPTSPRPSGEGGAGLTRVAVIGSSTGGPSALHRILAELPGDLACGLLVVQHMPTGFTRSLAEHLDGISALQVREAADGDVLADGHCLVAPGGYHLVLAADGTVRLDEGPHRHGVRPSVDVTLESVAAVAPGGAVAVILTGMGMDGARGARLLRQRGGTVVAQDEATCVVYGMPRAVVEMGLAHHVVPLHQMAAFLTRLLGAGRARHETSRGPTQATAQGTAQASARVDGGAACRG